MIRFTAYAEARIRRRRLSRGIVLEVLEKPEQVTDEDHRKAAQSRFMDQRSGRQHLLRVIYEERGEDRLVITVYETSKISKYWRTP